MTDSEQPAVTIIVARARNGVIGAHNAMPWHLPEELQHFKATTIGHAVIMGRKTFDSIGKPLPGRRIIVVTQNHTWQCRGCESAKSLTAALALCQAAHPQMIKTEQVFVAGGAQLYRAALPLAQRLLITEIDLEPEGDVFFSAPDPLHWAKISSVDYRSKNGTAYQIQDWRLSSNRSTRDQQPD